MRFADDPSKEDYSLRYAPAQFRQWKPWQVWLTAIGSLAAMAGYAIGGGYALNFGFANALGGTAVSVVVIFATALPLAVYIARHNLDIDLLTRGAGFGYLGSTLTSLVYATFTLIYVAFEGAIMAQAVTAVTPIPIRWSYVVVSVAIVPLVIYGMSFTSKFQAWTQPLWMGLLFVALISVATTPGIFHQMTLLGGGAHHSSSGVPFSGIVMLAIAAALLSGVAQIGEQGDYLRFMPDRDATNRRSWWVAVVLGGPGMVIVTMFAFVAGLMLTAYALPRTGVALADVPVTMFDQAFSRVFGHGELALVLAVALVILSQLKINIMNAYSGSLSWSNFFSRLLHRHPGRVYWLVFQVAIGLVIMEAGVFNQIDKILAVYSNLAVAWIGCLVSDLVLNKKLLKLSPPIMEFKRAHLYNFNPVGFGSMLIAAAVSFVAYAGVFGPTAKQLSSFIALGVALVVPPVIAWATKGRYYIARTSELPDTGDAEVECVACGGSYDRIDMAMCPFHSGAICSLCCSTDGSCHDACKKTAAGVVDLPTPVLSGTSQPAGRTPVGATSEVD
jgi:purine-cytosine permease-like protein